MIILINDENRHLYPEYLDDMFQVRADVFKTRLDWDVVVENGREIDRFDDVNPTYVVSLCEETGEFQGAVRLLPTMGPNMLRDVFAQLLDGGEHVAHPGIWESSRFSIRTDLPRVVAGKFIHEVTIELLLGIIECAQRNGIYEIVSVYDARMVRIFRQIGCDAYTVGTPQRIGGVMTHAGLFPTTDAFWRKLAAAADIKHRVIKDYWMPPVTQGAMPNQGQSFVHHSYSAHSLQSALS
jgi:acyl homoserine lactone synthase